MTTIDPDDAAPSFGPPGFLAPEQPVFAPAPAFAPPAPAPAPLALASLSYRFAASCIDAGIPLVLAVSVGIVSGVVGADLHAAVVAAVVVMVAFILFNHLWVAVSNDGQTLGKKFAAIRVVCDDGRPYSYGIAFVRDVLSRAVSLVPIVGLIDCVTALREDRRTLHDELAGTRVVRAPGYERRRVPLTLATLAFAALMVVLIALPAIEKQRNLAPSGPYSGPERASFVAGCERGGVLSSSECGCTYDYIAARVTHGELERVEGLPRDQWAPETNQVIADAMGTCAPGSVPGSNPA